MYKIKLHICLNLLLVILFYFTAASQHPVINIDFKKEIGEMKPIWAWFGYDEPNFTYMKDGKKLLSELAALSPVPVFVRTHNLLTSAMALQH
jgi:xylan 1,4-beta-xylosidase